MWNCKICLIFSVLILGLQSKVWINPSFKHVSLCVKVKFRQSILDLSMIAEEGFALRHCLLARVDWPFLSEDGRTVWALQIFHAVCSYLADFVWTGSECIYFGRAYLEENSVISTVDAVKFPRELYFDPKVGHFLVVKKWMVWISCSNHSKFFSSPIHIRGTNTFLKASNSSFPLESF